MKKIGIIVEYNPFHNGHIYQINKIKELFPNSLITIILNSNFTQRGEFSFLTKWEKTTIALKNEVDLVIEMPSFFGTQSADIFSYYAISILEKLKIDYLVFGSEMDDVDTLKLLASTMIYNKDYNMLVKNYLKSGNSYPAALSKALYNLTNVNLINSNDLLGVSYIKTILLNNFQIKPFTIKRTNNYLDKNLTENISSATSIRNAYLNNLNIEKYVPKDTIDYLNINKNYQTEYFKILKYKLISEINDLDKYLDVKEGIDKKIKKIILNVNTYQELIDNIKSKRYTYNRLNRMFLHILLNIKENDNYDINYIRVLGFSNNGRLYLKNIKNNIDLNIITNYKDTTDPVLKLELKSTIIYLNIIGKNNLIKQELKSIPIQIDKNN